MSDPHDDRTFKMNIDYIHFDRGILKDNIPVVEQKYRDVYDDIGEGVEWIFYDGEYKPILRPGDIHYPSLYPETTAYIFMFGFKTKVELAMFLVLFKNRQYPSFQDNDLNLRILEKNMVLYKRTLNNPKGFCLGFLNTDSDAK